MRLIPDHNRATQEALSVLISAMPFHDIQRPCRPEGVVDDLWQDCVIFDWRLANIGILPDSLQLILAQYLRGAWPGWAGGQLMKPDRHAGMIVGSVREALIYGAMDY